MATTIPTKVKKTKELANFQEKVFSPNWVLFATKVIRHTPTTNFTKLRVAKETLRKI